MKLVTAGAINEVLIEIIKNNVRIPEQVLGDLWKGKTREGDGQVLIDLLADEPVTMSFMADQLRTPAPGMHPSAAGRAAEYSRRVTDRTEPDEPTAADGRRRYLHPKWSGP